MKKSIQVLLLILCVFINGSCAILGNIISDSGKLKAIGEAASAISQATEVMTPSQEYYLGRAVAANILSNYELAKYDKRTSYVNAICQAIVLSSDKPDSYAGYHVGILKSNEINAFATSAGHILLTQGLLDCAQTEDAIAAIIAHEIAHIHLQHSVKAIKSSRALNAVLATSKAVAEGFGLGEITEGFSSAVDEVLNTLVNSGYSKAQEYEADKKALGLMHNVGYNPYAMADMLEVLRQKSAGATTGFSKTHPSPESRLKEVEKSLSKDYSTIEKTKRFPREM